MKNTMKNSMKTDPIPSERDQEQLAEDYAEDMDGDFDSGMASAGFGTDEVVMTIKDTRNYIKVMPYNAKDRAFASPNDSGYELFVPFSTDAFQRGFFDRF